MRSVWSLAAMGLLSALSLVLAPQRGLSEEKAPPARGVVYMQRSSKFIVPFMKNSYAYSQAPLLREIHRQAFLIAARDQLGLTTRDAYLGDWMPTEGDDAPFEMLIFHNKPTTLRVLRGFTSAKTTVYTSQPEIALMPTVDILGVQLPLLDYRRWLVDAESLSRGEYMEALKKSGFQGAAHQWKADGGVPEEIERLLERMTFTTQYDAIRRLHNLIRDDGESPARLGAMIRGYANLGAQTQFYWNPAHKVFKARALLYAQRLLSRNEHSPEALWHRAYAFGMVGLHCFALEDLQAADKLVGNMKEAERSARPDWADLIDAYCRYDARRLKGWQGKPGYVELANLLRFFTARMSGEKTMKVQVALEIAPNMPECYPLHDGVCQFHGVSTGHRATSEWFEITGRTLYSRLRAMPGLHEPVAEIAEEMDAAVETAPREEFQARANLVRALLDAEKPPAKEAADAKPRLHPGDAGEPSWAALGLLIRELSFVQVMRRAYFENNMLCTSSKEFRELSAPLTAGHPYAAYIDTFELEEAAKRAAWKIFKFDHPEDLERQQYDMYNMYYFKYHPDEKKRMNILSMVALTQVDSTAHDLNLELEQIDVTNYKKDAFERSVFCLLVISPHAPYPKAIAATAFGDMFADKLSEWEKTADQNPRLCKELARKCISEKRWEEAAKWAKTAFDLCPVQDAAFLLGEAHWRQGRKDHWVAALERYLDYPDYSLAHANVCQYIAAYYMRQKDWEKAMKYASAAADTYSGWGLNVAADCYEGMQSWEESEKLRKAITQRYHSAPLNWYYFCRRTGHGDLEAARDLAVLRVGSDDFQKSHQQEAAVFYMLEKKPEQAAKLLADFFQNARNLTDGLFLTMLYDELGDVKARDETLAHLLAANYEASGGFTLESRDALVGLAKMIDADLKAGGKGNLDLSEADRSVEAMEKSLDAPPNRHNNFYPLCHKYLLGCYLGLHGKPEDAVRYWKKCLADTEVFNTWGRTLAGAKLCDRGIKPESYKELWEKPKENEKQ